MDYFLFRFGNYWINLFYIETTYSENSSAFIKSELVFWDLLSSGITFLNNDVIVVQEDIRNISVSPAA